MIPLRFGSANRQVVRKQQPECHEELAKMFGNPNGSGENGRVVTCNVDRSQDAPRRTQNPDAATRRGASIPAPHT